MRAARHHRLALLLAVVPATGYAQEIPAAMVDSVFSVYNRTNGPGCAVGVFQNGRIAYARGYGMADLNQGMAITPRTAFYIASTSKQFAAASLTLLAAQGKVSLDDPVRKYVPELPEYANAVTLRHLMHHTSGIRDYLGLWGMSGRSIADEIPEEFAIDLIARQRALDFAPGTRWSYSNSGYFLISVVVKRASGMSLREFSTANIFAPLGMRDTHFHDDNTMVVPRRAEGYQPDGKGGYQIVRTSFALVGDGGLITTIEDLARWDENFHANRLAGGDAGLVQRLYTPGRLSNGEATTYASGLMVRTYRGLPTIEHGGSFIGFRAELLRFPGAHTSVAVLCNDYTAPSEMLAKRVADVVLAGTLGSATASAATGTPAVAPALLDRYAGRYELMPGLAATIVRAGNAMQLTMAGQQLPLNPTSDSTFVSPGLPGTITFRRLADGANGLVAPAFGLETPATALRPAVPLTPAERQALAGRYLCDELLTTFTVQDQQGRLMVRGGMGAWLPLEPFQPGELTTGSAKVVVERDTKGNVTGLSLNAARMRNIKLVRVAGSR